MLILPFLYVASLYHKDACYKESLRKRPKWLPCKTPSKCQPGKASKLRFDGSLCSTFLVHQGAFEKEHQLRKPENIPVAQAPSPIRDAPAREVAEQAQAS